jgi:predicted nucleic acid-binding protein
MRGVLDASVALTWLLGDAAHKEHAYAFSVLASQRSGRHSWAVPVVWGLEVANVIARSEARGLVTEAQSIAFLELLQALRIERDETSAALALTDTLQLARRGRLPSSDASYLELALRLDAPLATLDADLLKAARLCGVKRLEPK